MSETSVLARSTSPQDIGLLSVRKFESPYMTPRTLSFNPAERAVLLTIGSDKWVMWALLQQAQGKVKDSSVDGKKGSGQSAIFAVLRLEYLE